MKCLVDEDLHYHNVESIGEIWMNHENKDDFLIFKIWMRKRNGEGAYLIRTLNLPEKEAWRWFQQLMQEMSENIYGLEDI